MNRTVCFLLGLLTIVSINAQQAASTNSHKVTFKLKLNEITTSDTAAIIWLVLPYVEGTTVQNFTEFPVTVNADGLYEQAIDFPDSLLNKNILYLYTVTGAKYDIYRNFVLTQTDTQERTDRWGFVDGLQGNIKATKMLFTAPDSPEETTAFAKPYRGITTNGTPIKNLFPLRKTGVLTTAIKNAMSNLLSTLNADQKRNSVFPIGSIEWRRWHNIEDWKRAGICLETMTVRQKELAFEILKSSLSAKGFQKAKNIMSMEAYLATLLPDIKSLGGEKYWFTFYGTPSFTQPYGWQIEGHHLVINYFVLGDQIVMTPTFMGSEPTLIDKGDKKGFRTFEAEEKKGMELYLDLDSAQQKIARVWNKKDFDFNRSEAFRDNEIIAKMGIAGKDLSKAQKLALLDLIAEYVNNMTDGQAKVKMEEVRKYLDETNFTWIQSDDIMTPFYYRIHSPVILIEFDHQSPVFLQDPSKPAVPTKMHIHTVVRTPNGNDYGRDLLEEHLKIKH